MKVYLVSDGEYDDYAVKGIFSTPHKAQVFALRNGFYNAIEELEIDPVEVEDADVYYTHWFRIIAEGSHVRIEKCHPDDATLLKTYNWLQDDTIRRDAVHVKFTTEENYDEDPKRGVFAVIDRQDRLSDVVVEKFATFYDATNEHTPIMDKVHKNLSDMGLI